MKQTLLWPERGEKAVGGAGEEAVLEIRRSKEVDMKEICSTKPLQQEKAMEF